MSIFGENIELNGGSSENLILIGTDFTEESQSRRGDRVVDINNEFLGVTKGKPNQAERYRNSLVLAFHDGGVRSLCTAGRNCALLASCGFCPDGLLRPAPVDGHDMYPSAVMQARDLWTQSLVNLLPGFVWTDHVMATKSSVGAMLFAAHVQGHNCLSSAFDGAFELNVPHSIRSILGVASWARIAGQKIIPEFCATRRLMIMTMSVVSANLPQSTQHVFMVPAALTQPFQSQTVTKLAPSGTVYSFDIQCVEYKTALKKGMECVIDKGFKNPIQLECIHPKCNSMPTGHVYCLDCVCTVKYDGHKQRCRVGRINASYDMLLRRAQIGDMLHRMDVLLVLMQRDVPSAQRTIFATEYLARSGQAAFMRFAGYNGTDAVLSAWFEAMYDYFRPFYWEVTFGTYPSSQSVSISAMDTRTLDPHSLGETGCLPDYQEAWKHLLRVDRGGVIDDDPVRVAVRALRRGESDTITTYIHRFSSIPVPLYGVSAFAISSEDVTSGCCGFDPVAFGTRFLRRD